MPSSLIDLIAAFAGASGFYGTPYLYTVKPESLPDDELLQPPAAPSKPRRSMLSIILALVLLTVVLVVLTFLTLGSFGPVIMMALILFFFVAFHYLVWGWWLGPSIRQEAAAMEEREKD